MASSYAPEVISKVPYLYLPEQALAIQVAVPSAATAEAASTPDFTCITVSALTQVKVTVVPDTTWPLADT